MRSEVAWFEACREGRSKGLERGAVKGSWMGTKWGGGNQDARRRSGPVWLSWAGMNASSQRKYTLLNPLIHRPSSPLARPSRTGPRSYTPSAPVPSENTRLNSSTDDTFHVPSDSSHISCAREGVG